MKRVSIFLLLFLFTLSIRAQLSGNGSFASPYKGTLNQNVTWSSDTYVGGDILTSAYVLTVNSGVKVIFVTDSADIKIRGTGSLVATGSSGSVITFTADDDNDGNYGESGERWGHISFESSTGNSALAYCIFEYGYKSGSDIEGYGGAIHANTNNLTISNCIFRNNYAQWGGAMFVNKSRSPAISNCYFTNNQSVHAGGGLYFWTGAGSTVSNSIFDNNKALEPTYMNYSGGGLATGTGCAIKVVGCTFVNNTSTRPEGQSIVVDRSPNARIVNTIFWGTAEKQVYCYSTSSASSFINCAYRGITYSVGTPVNPVILNSSNTASDGPNFVASDGSDWSIKYISPCRDAGVNAYTGVIIPTLDYEGNSRVGTTDIGAYEVQYSLWKTTAASSDWSSASNWEGNVSPSAGTGDVIIPKGATNYPTGGSPDFTLGSDNVLIVEAGAKLTLGNFSNNGAASFRSDATGTASVLVGSHSGNQVNLELFLSGGGTFDNDDYKWHYISSPVNSLAASVIAPTYTPDLVQYIESRPVFSLLEGWVAYDGYQYSSGQMGGPTFSSLTAGKGYNFWDDVDNTVTFSGMLNSSDVTASLSFSGSLSLNGFNLLGNPFMSGLNWDNIISSIYFSYPANTSKGLYFTRDNMQCSYISGVGIPGDVTGIIPPMQGFFTKTSSTGNSITLPAAARTQSNIHPRYKSETVIPLVRLAIFEESVSNDETVVRFDAEAKTDLDNDFDALKLFISPSKTIIYTSLSGVNYAINGQPFPQTTIEIPVVVKVISQGEHKISAIQLQGLENYDVAIKDNLTGYTANLKTSPELIFSSAAGSYADRFVLKVGNFLTGTEDILKGNRQFNIYSSDGFINIVPLSDEWSGKNGSVFITDLTGKRIREITETGFFKDSVLQIDAPASRGIYIVEIISGLNRYTGKIVVRY